MTDPLLERLDDWRSQYHRSLEYMRILRKSRSRSQWPPRLEAMPRFGSSRVLVARGDRFGDMMLTLPLLARVRAASARLCVMTPDRAARALLTAVGIECIAKPAEAVAFDPDVVLLPTTCRTLRSRRHPERWEFVLEIFATLPGVPVVAPSMRRAEALSLYIGPCVTPLSGHTVLTVLDRFANGLGLPRDAEPLLARWTRPPAERARGAVVLNLSAGRPGESDRRDLPIAFWSEVASAIGASAPIASIAQPGDDERRAQAEADPVLSKAGVLCFEDVSEAAAWLGRQRLLISPETGLCHLARNLALPMVVLTPPKKVPYFYPRSKDTGFVFATHLDEIAPRQAALAAQALLTQG